MFLKKLLVSRGFDVGWRCASWLLGRDHGVWVDERARERAEDKQRRMSTDVSMREIKTDTDRFLHQASANMRVESRGRDYKMVEVPLHHDLMMKDNPCCKMFNQTSELWTRRPTSLMNSSHHGSAGQEEIHIWEACTLKWITLFVEYKKSELSSNLIDIILKSPWEPCRANKNKQNPEWHFSSVPVCRVAINLFDLPNWTKMQLRTLWSVNLS